ncbi:MAG TPA: hypothetical protein VEV62_15860 [Parafilimonas sp.]|jgi:hypothetical protein|nr:hypothetical protein [Parafilimonas sp.]
MIGKKIMGKKIKFATDDKTAIAVNDNTTKNSFEVKTFFSGLINKIAIIHMHKKILSSGTDVSVFIVQNRSTITNIRLKILANSQCANCFPERCM